MTTCRAVRSRCHSQIKAIAAVDVIERDELCAASELSGLRECAEATRDTTGRCHHTEAIAQCWNVDRTAVA
jgi:hypothetical protein